MDAREAPRLWHPSSDSLLRLLTVRSDVLIDGPKCVGGVYGC